MSYIITEHVVGCNANQNMYASTTEAAKKLYESMITEINRHIENECRERDVISCGTARAGDNLMIFYVVNSNYSVDIIETLDMTEDPDKGSTNDIIRNLIDYVEETIGDRATTVKTLANTIGLTGEQLNKYYPGWEKYMDEEDEGGEE